MDKLSLLTFLKGVNIVGLLASIIVLRNASASIRICQEKKLYQTTCRWLSPWYKNMGGRLGGFNSISKTPKNLHEKNVKAVSRLTCLGLRASVLAAKPSHFPSPFTLVAGLLAGLSARRCLTATNRNTVFEQYACTNPYT